MTFRLLVAACSALLLPAAQAADAPTAQQVQDWWKAKSSEAMTLDEPLQEVHLMNKEVAFIAPVGFYQRGRNDTLHAVLIRPELHEVRELPYPVGDKLSVQDIDGDGVSELLSTSISSGQGTTSSVRAIVRLDGFTPIVMHAVVEDENLGNCYPSCDQVSVDWKFGQHPQTGEPTLTETVTFRKGKSPDHLTARKEVRRYMLMQNTFVRADSFGLRYSDETKPRKAR